MPPRWELSQGVYSSRSDVEIGGRTGRNYPKSACCSAALLPNQAPVARELRIGQTRGVTTIELTGRSISHFTRVARIFAHELDVEVRFKPILDLTVLDPAIYGDNPALKMPTLHVDGSALFGTENICRRLAELSPRQARIVWPQELGSDLARNAQELLWHAMAAQVQIITGNILGKLPADNVYFVKGRQGFEGALAWLEKNLSAVLAELPPERELSLFEVVLFCLVEHIPVRGTLSLEPYSQLRAFASRFGLRPSAVATPYVLDAKPAAS
ncbi:MAG TPA: glutathione S-transferase family protein [Polyangiaceae bacterium]|nr:glutathione S-transferase family protein [Polyangiaceae bacterium]